MLVLSLASSLTLTLGEAEAAAPYNGRIAYSNSNGIRPPDIFTIKEDGTDIQVPGRTFEHAEHSAEYSPDGGRIAFVSNRDGDNEIFVMNEDGSGVRNLTQNSVSDTEPTWSPDGTLIAFVRSSASGQNIFVIPAAGGASTNLTNSLAPTYEYLDWSPVANVIVFARDNEIWTVPTDSTDPVPVQTNLTADGLVYQSQPSWSPDGTQLAFVAGQTNPNGGLQIWRMEVANPANKVRLDDPTDGLDDYQPTWSPDGMRIAYTNNTSGHVNSGDINVMDAADGGNDVQLTTSLDVDFAPNWQPSSIPPCTIEGTAASETLAGTEGNDVICGGSGNDRLIGGGGNDWLLGGNGNDTLVGGSGDDAIRGDLGTDVASFSGSVGVIASLSGGTASGLGQDTFASIEGLTGSSSADTLRGSSGKNTLIGAGGSDALFGLGDNDRLFGEGGNDRLNGGPGKDFCRQGPGSGKLRSCER